MTDYKTIGDYLLLDYVRQMGDIPQHYFTKREFKEEDRVPYMRGLYDHLKQAWYGLSYAQAVADSTFPSREVDSLIRRRQDEWYNRYYASVIWSLDHEYVKYPDPRTGSASYWPQQIELLGSATLTTPL